MLLSHSVLPSDPDELRAFAQALQAENASVKNECAALQDEYTNVKAALEAEIYAKTLHIEKLKAQLAALRRARFGRSSEKLDREIEQLELLIADTEELQAETAERMEPREKSTGAQTRAPMRPVRKPLPDHLPRVSRTKCLVRVRPAAGRSCR